MIPALMLTAAWGGRVHADVDATPQIPRIPWVDDSIDTNQPKSTLPPGGVAAPPPSAPEPIVDPLPPAFWSGLSTIVLGGAVVSFRSVRRHFR